MFAELIALAIATILFVVRACTIVLRRSSFAAVGFVVCAVVVVA